MLTEAEDPGLVDFEDIWLERELMDREFCAQDLTLGLGDFRAEEATGTAVDADGKWYGADTVILVGHDEVEALLKRSEFAGTYLQDEDIFMNTLLRDGGGPDLPDMPSAVFENQDVVMAAAAEDLGESAAFHSKKEEAAPKRAAVKHFSESLRSSIFPDVMQLASPGHTFGPKESVEAIYEAMKRDHGMTAFTVVDGGAPVGFMTKAAFNELLGGRYGYWLYSKKTIGEMARGREFLAVDHRMPIDYVTKLAMQRPYERLYNPIVVVEDENVYRGVVTIKDLLDTYTRVEVEAAVSTNPLTKLPGNIIIEGEIARRIFGDAPYCIIYIDVDNFKAYNDAYGFKNGDLVLKFTSDILKECAENGEFVGHIGGDDFIIVCDYHEGDGVCRSILEKFQAGIGAFYRDVDLENGFIVSTNRHGVVDKFPIASLSIAGISNRASAYRHLDEFSKAIAQLKKKCKKQAGNYFEIL